MLTNPAVPYLAPFFTFFACELADGLVADEVGDELGLLLLLLVDVVS